MSPPPEPLPAVHKLLRVALAAVAARLGRAPGPQPALLAEAEALLTAVTWRNAWVTQQMLPLLELHEPGAAAPARQALTRVQAQVDAALEALRALPLQPAVEQPAAWPRLYRRWTALQSQVLALLHHEETSWQAALWRALPAPGRDALSDRLRATLPLALRAGADAALTPAEAAHLMNPGDPHA